MFHFAKGSIGVLAALMLTAFQSAPPGLPPKLAALADNADAARSFDYMALKAEGADLKALSDAVHMRTRIDPDTRRCLTEAEAELQMNLASALAAVDQAAFSADRVAADEALAKWRAFSQRIISGEPAAEPPFKWVSDRYAQARSESDPRVRELLLRTARDQLNRQVFSGGDQVWGELSPGARIRVEAVLNRDMCETDGENTAWLKADIAANGWYLISTTGEHASSAAWLMAQHADRDRAFQREVLALLEPLVQTGETSASSYAYLYDRVAVSGNRPQRYGTQGRCVARNLWEPDELEDPERVQALRDEVEVGSLAEYTAHMHQYCADFSG
ncbi:DUF6624 domain-containing protein [uncultured Brevundimonas sp.]|uniref:DUF6624 domain-containing protein n=1 Tax=uncultured Brevundimonas sp. TaxID=213418 RepID=UPI0026215743|nr:DUF6624 domain-containing protein [uncultured Brevundimonas sp.]